MLNVMATRVRASLMKNGPEKSVEELCGMGRTEKKRVREKSYVVVVSIDEISFCN